MAQKDCLGASFETIAAYGANAAMMHYAPMEDTCAELEPRGFLLVDSGGQYRDGTTDITRTYALGPLTDEEREAYTLVLKCHIAAACAVFKAVSYTHLQQIEVVRTLVQKDAAAFALPGGAPAAGIVIGLRAVPVRHDPVHTLELAQRTSCLLYTSCRSWR